MIEQTLNNGGTPFLDLRVVVRVAGNRKPQWLVIWKIVW